MIDDEIKEVKKAEEEKKEKEEKIKKGQVVEEESPGSIVTMFWMILKLITLDINKIHVRYEDDFFADKEPFSFGVLLDSFKFFNTEKDVKFEEPLDIKYDEFWPSETDDLHLKKLEINDIRVYWNSKSAAYIPESLLQDTWYSRNKIFEAVGADTLH